MMLDRGELKDWFGSTEIMAEAALAASASICSWCTCSRTERRSWIRGLFKDRNFVVGTSLCSWSASPLATMTLLPPMLQNWPAIRW